jgi:23S rRNA pseudouridine2605 synthase
MQQNKGRRRNPSKSSFKEKNNPGPVRQRDNKKDAVVKSGNSYSRGKSVFRNSESSAKKSEGFKKNFRTKDDRSVTENRTYGNRNRSSKTDERFPRPFNKQTAPFKKTSFNDNDNPIKPGLKKRYSKKSESNVFEKDHDSTFKQNRRNTFSKSRTTDKSKPFTKRGKHKNSNTDKELNATEGTFRLNRYIANSGICSRREADELIAAGLIMVNGKVVTEMGIKVSQNDVIKYNGETIRNEKPRYLLLNKPKDYITTTDDPQDRRTVMHLIADACKERIYPVGRLDRNTTGVLLFTNDGDLARKLTHPSFEVQKIYHVELDHNLKPSDMETIKEGITLEDGFVKVDDIQYDAGFKDKKQIGVEIHSGKNRIIRRIFESLGYKVIKLDRVVFAGLTKKDVARGKWRFLTDMELNALKMATARIEAKVKTPRKRIVRK